MGVQVTSPANASTSGCGAATFTPAAGNTSLSFANGTLAPNSNCTIKVDVTVPANGTYDNISNNLFIDGTTDTGNSASATLTGGETTICVGGQTLASWTVPATATDPPDLTGGVPTTVGAKVNTATAAAILPGSTGIVTSGVGDSTSWEIFGFKDAGQYADFVVDTKSYREVVVSFYGDSSANPGPTQIVVSYDGGSGFTNILTLAGPITFATQQVIDLTGLTNTTGNTTIRISGSGAKNDNSGAGVSLEQYSIYRLSGARPAAHISKSIWN